MLFHCVRRLATAVQVPRGVLAAAALHLPLRRARARRAPAAAPDEHGAPGQAGAARVLQPRALRALPER